MTKRWIFILPFFLLPLVGCEPSQAYEIFSCAKTGEAAGTEVDGYLNETSELYSAVKATNPNLLSSLFNITPSCLKGVCDLYRFEWSPNIGALEGQTYLIYQAKAYLLGEAFGGHDVTHYAYVRNQEKSLLYFIYSFGSGIHRSLINVFDFATSSVRQVDEDHKTFWDSDLQFAFSEEDKLEVRDSTYSFEDCEGFAITMVPGEVVYSDLLAVALL